MHNIQFHEIFNLIPTLISNFRFCFCNLFGGIFNVGYIIDGNDEFEQIRILCAFFICFSMLFGQMVLSNQ